MRDYCMKCMERLGEDGICPDCGTWEEPERAPHQLAPGTTLIGRYLVGEILGQGGFGITYIGRDLLLDLRIAVKEYYPTGFANRNTGASDKVTVTGSKSTGVFERGKERFLDEARSLARYRGEPGVVDVLNFFEENGTAYIVMEYLDGSDLLDILKQEGPLPAEWVFTSFAPVMDALEKMHADNVFHRDISPDNVMLLKDGGLRLMDFGAARSIAPESPQTVSIMLKAGYAPEEQYRANGKQGPWTDVYALCATMYKCITGITPADALQRQRGASVLWPSALGISIPAACEAVLKKGMSVEMTDRYQSIGAMREALDAALAEAGVARGAAETPEADDGRTRYVTSVAGNAWEGSFTRNPSWEEPDSAAFPEGAGSAAGEAFSFCPNCGYRLGADDVFCPSCGRRVAGDEPADASGRAPAASADDAKARAASDAGQAPTRAATPAFKPAGDIPSVSHEAAREAPTPQQPAPAPSQPTQPAWQQAAPAPIPGQGSGQVGDQARRQDQAARGRFPLYIAIAAAIAVIAGIAFGSGIIGGGQNPDTDPVTAETGGAVEVKAELADYNWDELSAISAEIAQTASQEEAIEVAKRYNLVDSDGKLDASQTKTVKVNGKKHPVHIIGFAHDVTANGEVAGITFQFADCLDEQQVNNSGNNEGGWEASLMRRWLRTDVLPELPESLSNVIVPVEKKSNNVGEADDDDTAAVTATSDALWLPARAEVLGPENCESKINKSEGAKYQLFDEMGTGTDANAVLKMKLNGSSSAWWLRTTSNHHHNLFLYVQSNGEVDAGYADKSRGVAPCFCI